MGNRRMFSNTVVNSDYFLDMSPSAQLLYFHVGMNADDDGFCAKVNSIARLIGVGPEAVDELVDHSFLIRFEDKACVVKHWKVNNILRSTEKHRTEFREDLEKLYLKDNGIYTTDPAKGKPVIPENERVHKGAQSKFLQQNAASCGKNATEDKRRQDKIREDKTREDKTIQEEVNTTIPIQFVNEDGVPEEGNEMKVGSTENLKNLIEKNIGLNESEKQRYFDFIDSLCEKYSLSFVTMAAMACMGKIPWCPNEKEKESFFELMEDTLADMTQGREE